MHVSNLFTVKRINRSKAQLRKVTFVQGTVTNSNKNVDNLLNNIAKKKYIVLLKNAKSRNFSVTKFAHLKRYVFEIKTRKIQI